MRHYDDEPMYRTFEEFEREELRRADSIGSVVDDIFEETVADGLVGQLNSPWDRAPIRAEVVTELTEPFDAMAGTVAGSGGSIAEMTITTTARVFPTDAGSTTVCGVGSKGAMSQQRARAHVIIQL